MKKLPDKIHVSMEGGDCILTVKPSDSLDFTEADYDFIDKQLFPLEEGDEVEYIRKDTFVEKACVFISLNVADYIDVTHKGCIEHLALQEKFIESFKKYIEE